MSGRYFDQPSSSSARSNSASGGSYTDRFRVDDDFPSDFSAPTASASSGSVALGETSTSTRRSRKQIPAPTLLVSLIGMYFEVLIIILAMTACVVFYLFDVY